MIRRRKKISITCSVLTALGLTGASIAAEAPAVIVDGFEDLNPPAAQWQIVGGCPNLDTTQRPISGSQSLSMGLPRPCHGGETEHIGAAFAPSAGISVTVWVDLRGLDQFSGAPFELLGLYEGDAQGNQATAVKLGQTDNQLWVTVEAAEDAGNVNPSERLPLENVMQGDTLVRFQLRWEGAEQGADDGSVTLDVDGDAGSSSLPLVDLDNDTFRPDFVLVGYGNPPPGYSPASMGGFVIDDFELRPTPRQ